MLRPGEKNMFLVPVHIRTLSLPTPTQTHCKTTITFVPAGQLCRVDIPSCFYVGNEKCKYSFTHKTKKINVSRKGCAAPLGKASFASEK